MASERRLQRPPNHARPSALGSRGAVSAGAIPEPMDGNHLMNVEAIRRRAREHIERGAFTESYGADRDVVLKLLNAALATELICVLRYKRHHFMASGLHAEPAAAEFLEHANQEQQHADQIAERIVQLGGEPDFSPDELSQRSHAEYVEGENLIDMIREDLIAERVAIESYTEIIRYLGNGDPTSRVMLEGILATEEEHAEDMRNLLEGVLRPVEAGAAVSTPARSRA
jgi:bacterioferritin